MGEAVEVIEYHVRKERRAFVVYQKVSGCEAFLMGYSGGVDDRHAANKSAIAMADCDNREGRRAVVYTCNGEGDI